MSKDSRKGKLKLDPYTGNLDGVAADMEDEDVLAEEEAWLNELKAITKASNPQLQDEAAFRLRL